MKEKSRQDVRTAKGNILGPTEQFMRVVGRTIKLMVKESLQLMAKFIRESSRMIKYSEESIILQMEEKDMRDNLKTKNIKDKENSIRKDCILMKEALPIT